MTAYSYLAHSNMEAEVGVKGGGFLPLTLTLLRTLTLPLTLIVPPTGRREAQ